MLTSIAIDATHLHSERPTGVERYVDSLLPALSGNLVAAGVEVTWIGHTIQSPVALPTGAFWQYSPHVRFWSELALPAVLRQLSPSLFFTPSGIPPTRYAGATACTVHDMSVYAMPEAYSWPSRFRLTTMSKKAVGKAAAVIVPSHYTAAQVQTHWDIPESRLAVVPHGFSMPDVTPAAVAVPNPYLLYVGRIERKKDLLPLIDGFAQTEGFNLVLAGGNGIGYEDVDRAIASVPGRISRLGYVSDSQLAWLYSHCLAVLVPSALEGFGFPVLEAFHYGKVPVCRSDGAVLEVAGDAALYANRGWKAAIEEVRAVDLKALAANGKERAKLFTWEAAAKDTADRLLAAC